MAEGLAKPSPPPPLMSADRCRYDGFEALKNQRFIVDDETGQIMSQIIRSFLLGRRISIELTS